MGKCKYCSKESVAFFTKTFKMGQIDFIVEMVVIDEDMWALMGAKEFSLDIFNLKRRIKYCQMCGRKL